MLAATSRPFREEKMCGDLTVAKPSSRGARTRQVVQRLYDLGADFRAFGMQESRPGLDALIGAHGMQVMVSRDPLYQLMKYEIRDVKQWDVEAHRAALRAEQAAAHVAANRQQMIATPC